MNRNSKSQNVAELFASNPARTRQENLPGPAPFGTQRGKQTRKRQRLTKIWNAIGDLARALVAIALGLWGLGSWTLPAERLAGQSLRAAHIFESNIPEFQFDSMAAQSFASLPGKEIL